jgi:hypothetical protein
MTALNRYLLTAEVEQRNFDAPTPQDIWLGDFNCHSPMWDEVWNAQLFTPPALQEVQQLIDLAATWNMQMALSPGVNTLEFTSSKNYTRPNNVWVSDKLRQNVTLCDVLPAGVLLRNCFLSGARFLLTLWTICDILTFQESGL